MSADEEPFTQECENCGNEIDEEQYNQTGVTDYCWDCPELCCDPRSKAFGCECDV